MTANKMMPTHGKRPEGLNEKEVVFVQEADGEILTYPVFYVEWDRVVAYCPIETPAPYVLEPFVPAQEYSKWIGKVCKFWNGVLGCPSYGVLMEYSKGNPWPFKTKYRAYRNCRPVTADEIVKE